MKSVSFAGLFLFPESPAKIQNGSLDVDAARKLLLKIFNRRKSLINSEDGGEINVLSAFSTLMRRNLNRNQGYYECSLTAYSMRRKLNF